MNWLIIYDNRPLGITEGSVRDIQELTKTLVEYKLKDIKLWEGDNYQGEDKIYTNTHSDYVVFSKVYIGNDKYITVYAYGMVYVTYRTIDSFLS